jgi:TatD DNase family protein
MLADSHCHLDAAEFDGDRAAVLDAARAAGVRGFLVPGVELASFAGLASLAAEEADIAPAYGIHPLYVAHAADSDLAALEDWLVRPETVAVGEIGLDHFVPDLPQQRLEHFYERQLQLAEHHGLPVVLHVRRAVEDIIRHLRRRQLPGGIAHAFNGSRQQADTLISMGFALGFGGAMSFAGSRRIRELAATLPLDAIVLETDAPDIPPEWAQDRRNEPANLARYAGILAALRGITIEEVASATTANALRVVPGLGRLMLRMGAGHQLGDVLPEP